MAYNDKVVDVTVVLGTQPIDTVGFETPLFIAIHNVFPERVRTYTDLDELAADGFAVGSPVYTFATKAFAGTFRPQALMIGRQAWESTVINFTGQTNVDPNNPVSFNVAAGAYTKSIVIPVTAASTPDSIATALASAINSDTTLNVIVGAVATAGVVTITPKGDGSLLATNNDEVVTTESDQGIMATSSDVIGEPFSIGIDYGNCTLTNTSTETVSGILPEIETANNNWYFLSTEQHIASAILGAAAYASANYKLHVYSTADQLSLVVDGNSIANQLKALQYDTSIGMYDPLADSAFSEGGIIGAMASNDPSYGDSIHLKTMPGVVAPTLSSSDRPTIWGQNLNFYRMINGVGAFWEGKCASGQYVDVVRFGHWLKFRSEESIFAYMSRRSNLGLSMKMSDDDMPNLKAVLMNSPLNVGITNGSILTGYDSVNKVFYDPVVTIPLRASIPSNDLASRTLNNVKVELVYNSSLHFVKIRISVLLDKTGSTSSSGQVTAGV